MKIKVGNWKVDSNTLLRLEWNKNRPRLILHEKYEGKVKWLLRGFTVVGIGTSFLSFDPFVGTGVSLGLIGLEQFFENTLFEYTTFIIQPPPDFEIQYDQWKTNGFAIPLVKNKSSLPVFGPAYADEAYAIKFFNYLRSWNNDEDEDKENRLIVSFVIEDDESYTTYIYANPGRKSLSEQFDLIEEVSRLEKYGKQQQRLIGQMIYWNKLVYKKDYMIDQFLRIYSNTESFIFAPFVLSADGKSSRMLQDLGILKHGYKFKKRNQLTEVDTEYYFK